MTPPSSACKCGAPAVARGKCKPCYDTWHSVTNPYRKRGRPPSALDLFVRRELARRRSEPTWRLA